MDVTIYLYMYYSLSYTYLYVLVIMELIPEIEMPSVSIEVDVTPSIQRHIEGSGNAEITCTILQGQGDIVWTFNGGILPEGTLVQTTTNISVLSITQVQLKHKGIYSCLVRNVDDVTIGNDIGIVEVMSEYTYTYIHTYIHTHINIYLHNIIYIHTYVHIYLHTYIHTYIYAYIHTYIHYIHIYM